MLQSPRIKYHVKNIDIDQSISKNALFKHKYLQNINKLYRHAGKCDNQQQFKYIIKAAMVSTNEGVTNNSHRSSMTPTTVKKPSARKPLCLLTHILDVKNKTATRWFGDDKSKRKADKEVTTPWALKPKRKGN